VVPEPGVSEPPPNPLNATTVPLQRCAGCHLALPDLFTVCPKCGAVRDRVSVAHRDWRSDLATATQARWRVPMSVSYSSDALTFRGTIRDLGTEGTYVVSDLLDPEGTVCEVTLMPDGGSQMTFAGVVDHVVSSVSGHAGRPPGMSIAFTAKNADAEEWLDTLLANLGPADRLQRR
jgi:hypothetical protein